MHNHRWILVFILFLLLTNHSFAQKASRREWAIFQKGVKEYRSENWSAAEKIFSTIIEKLPDSKLTTANWLMLAKTFYKEKKYKKSLTYSQKFLKKFPASQYTDDIYFLIGENYFRLNRIRSAITNWLYVMEKSGDKRLIRKAEHLAQETMSYRLTTDEVEDLAKKQEDDFTREVIFYHLAKRYYRLGKTRLAMVSLQKLLHLPRAAADIYDQAQQLYDVLENKNGRVLRIAALLPLSGDNQDFGRALLDGAKLALNNYLQSNDPLVEIVPVDYGTDLTTALEKMKEIARDPSISAVWGPVENDITAACAVIADYEDLLLITPTATNDNLRNLSTNLIQLSAPIDVQAQKLARFAQDSLHLHRYASLSPIDSYFIHFTNDFIKFQKDFGNEVVAEQWYYPQDQDITRHFKAIKRVGLKLAFQDSVLQTDSTLTDHAVDSLYHIYLNKAEEKLKTFHSKIDSADIPVKSFDGFFLPIYKEDIGMMAAQFAYWNIQAQLLGNSDWYDEQALKKNKNYINGLIFVSDGYLNDQSWDFRKFRNDFRMTYKRTPDKLSLIGYDAFNFILSAVSGNEHSVNRHNIADYIEEAPIYSGIYCTFHIGKKRYNNFARILKVVYGQILPLN